jgi:DNA-binding XRE family transcriptional regulator
MATTIDHGLPHYAIWMRERRIQLGLTQDYLAKKLGVTRQAISLLEMGEGTLYTAATLPQGKVGRPATIMAEAVAKLLQTSVAELMGD